MVTKVPAQTLIPKEYRMTDKRATPKTISTRRPGSFDYKTRTQNKVFSNSYNQNKDTERKRSSRESGFEIDKGV